MSHFVVAEFRAAPGKLDDLTATLKAVLPETRAYDRYLAWRGETGVLAAVATMLDGGGAGFVPRKCVPAGC